ncbi:MAG: hypothetical protein RMI94_15140 [Bryobacterales bacterium]|nr:hypothetical protein [Bryobacterales bacterium]
MAVVAADLVRLHWARSEMRNLVAAAALAAATELDGTAAGLLRAREAAEAVWKRSLIATAVAKGAEADFGLSPTGPWRGEPGDLTRCCFVRVRAAGAVPLSLLPLLGRASARFVEAEAIAVPRLPPLGQAEPDGEADPVSPRLLTISVGSGRAVGAP